MEETVIDVAFHRASVTAAHAVGIINDAEFKVIAERWAKEDGYQKVGHLQKLVNEINQEGYFKIDATSTRLV